METFTVHIQKELSNILESLEPKLALTETKGKLVSLMGEIGIRDADTRERSLERITSTLNTYHDALATAYEHVRAELFKLVAQLEYPSRQ